MLGNFHTLLVFLSSGCWFLHDFITVCMSFDSTNIVRNHNKHVVIGGRYCFDVLLLTPVP